MFFYVLIYGSYTMVKIGQCKPFLRREFNKNFDAQSYNYEGLSRYLSLGAMENYFICA